MLCSLSADERIEVPMKNDLSWQSYCEYAQIFRLRSIADNNPNLKNDKITADNDQTNKKSTKKCTVCHEIFASIYFISFVSSFNYTN